ncbi:MAG TPA: hypothetical protein VMH33_10645 [Solirubrobacterales bacterium]|nr:hypothetical protein [Solirubrobacterales bacterium]
MVFDIRGRRGHVIKVVYALLALLMVASLFLVTGAFNLNSILGLQSSTESATSSLEKQAENLEAKLVKTPEAEDLLAGLTRTRINIADTMINNGEIESTSDQEEIKHQLALASESWSKYLKAAAEPSAGLAVQVAPSLFQLATVSSTNEEALENLEAAAGAQEIVAEQRPSVNSWSTLALYALYAQDKKTAEEAKAETLKLSTTKFSRESFENQYESTEKKAKEFGEGVKAEEAGKSKSAGKESLENPLGGLGGTSFGSE